MLPKRGKLYTTICLIEVQEGFDAQDLLDRIAQRLLDMPDEGMIDIHFSDPERGGEENV